MARTVRVSIRLDEDVKLKMQAVCKELGLSMNEAFTDFARKVGEEEHIPSDDPDDPDEEAAERAAGDPFYSEKNIRYLEGVMRDVKSGRARFAEHELIEAEL